MVDIQAFLDRTGMSGTELQEKLGVSSSLLTQYKKGRSNPSYEMLVRLLQEGMTIEEMFGPDIWQAVKNQAALESSHLELSDDECRKIVEHGLAMLRQR